VIGPGGRAHRDLVGEPQTAIKDLGGRRALSALFWIVSYGIRLRARRQASVIDIFFMHPSGSDLAQLAQLIEQGLMLRVAIACMRPSDF
jgi:alcohol dehydrogenase